MIEGLPTMLYKKLKALGKSRSTGLKVVASGERDFSAWVGMSVVSQLSSFRDQIMLAEDYEEEGPDLIHKLNILSLE